MKPYTVILMYPDYVADDYGENYLAHVDATDPTEAVKVAQRQAMKENGNEPDDDGFDREAAAYAPIAVFDGHLRDLQCEVQS